MRRLVNEAAEASAAVAKRQYDAGNMNDLAINTELTLASQTRLDLKRSEGDAAVEREHLNKMMGVWGSRTGWKTSMRLPELPAAEVSSERLESLAMEKRLDIGAARRQLQGLKYALSLAKTTRWTGDVRRRLDSSAHADRPLQTLLHLDIPAASSSSATSPMNVATIPAQSRQSQ